MSDRPVTKKDLDAVESKLEKKIDAVVQRMDSLEHKVEIIANEVCRLGQECVTRADLEAQREETSAALAAHREETRADMVALHEDLSRDIARHIEAGFTMMRDQFNIHNDRATAIEVNAPRLRADFTAHTSDFALHNKP